MTTLNMLFRGGFYITLFVVTVLALLPTQNIVITTGWDKSNHCLAFLTLLALMDMAYPRLDLWKKKILYLVLYAVLIECIQHYVPGRFFSPLDIVADVFGLSLYLLVRPLVIRHLSLTKWQIF